MRTTLSLIAVALVTAFAGTAAAHHQVVHADDFDLEAVTDLVIGDGVEDAGHLEAHINDDTGINNVDLDRDGVIDDVVVRERRYGGNVYFEFFAIPSSRGRYDDRVRIASMEFVETHGGGVEVHTAYDDQVDQHEYHAHTYVVDHHPSFFVWTYRPYRPVYVASYRHHTYRSRPVYRSGYRTRYRTQSRYYGTSRRYASTRSSRVVRTGPHVRTRTSRGSSRYARPAVRRPNHSRSYQRTEGAASRRSDGKSTARRSRGKSSPRRSTRVRRTRSSRSRR